MALSILSSPGNNSSVNNEMLFVIQEATKSNDQVNYPNYKYVLDVYVDSELVARLKADPDPVNYFGVFNISNILQSYVPSYGLKANYSSQTETYDIKLNYRVKLGEEYGDTLYTNLVEDGSDRSCFKTYKTRPFTTSDAVTDKEGFIFSNIPYDSDTLTGYKEDKWFILPIYDNVSGVIVSYNFDDGSTIIGGGGSVQYNLNGQLMQINMGFQKLATLLGLSETQKNQVTRLIFDTDDNRIYTVEYKCSKHSIITLAWLNPYGGYESYSFGLVNKKTNEVSRKEYAQLNYRINASGVVSYDENGVFYGSRKGYAANVKTSLKLTSHILTEAEYTWLADLFNSPDVYIYNSTLDKFFPVSISETNYEYRNYKNSRLTPLEFSVQFSDDYNAQFL